MKRKLLISSIVALTLSLTACGSKEPQSSAAEHLPAFSEIEPGVSSGIIEESSESNISSSVVVEDVNAYELYANLIKDYETKYGITKVEEEYDYFYYMTGLCFMKLVDFTQDGQEELLLVYEKDQDMGGDVFRTYPYEIWGLENNELTMLETGDLFGTDGGVQHVYLSKVDGMLYLVTGGEDSFGDYRYHGYADGKFGLIKEISWEDDENGDYSYTIDGETVSSEAVEEELGKWFSDVTEYNLNEACDEVLEQNEETKKMLYPYYEIVEEAAVSDSTGTETANATEVVSTGDPYNAFLETKGYKSYCAAWENSKPTQYAILDVNGDGEDEIIIIGDSDFGFGDFSVFSYNSVSQKMELLEISYDDAGNSNSAQYYGNLRYSPKYHALVCMDTNEGVGIGYWDYWTINGNNVSIDFTLQYMSNYDTMEDEFSIVDGGKEKSISSSDYDSYVKEWVEINWKDL